MKRGVSATVMIITIFIFVMITGLILLCRFSLVDLVVLWQLVGCRILVGALVNSTPIFRPEEKT